MGSSKVYKNAPISEAVFDIKIRFTAEPNLDRFKAIPETLRKQYPIEKKRMGFQGIIEFKADGPNSGPQSSSNSKIVGYIFSNAEGNRLFQFRLDGFSFNMLKPYSDWSSFCDEAFRIWGIYKTQISNYSIERLGLRYINRIGIPLPAESIEKYLTYVPPIPPSLPRIMNRFFMQVEIPLANNTTQVILTETVEQKDNNTDTLPFLLDIDCIQPINAMISDIELSESFNKLRNIKNEIFESCITDDARALFN